MLVYIIDIFWTPVPLVEGCPDELEHAGVVPHEAVYDGGRAAHVVHRGEGGHHGRHCHEVTEVTSSRGWHCRWHEDVYLTL